MNSSFTTTPVSRLTLPGNVSSGPDKPEALDGLLIRLSRGRQKLQTLGNMRRLHACSVHPCQGDANFIPNELGRGCSYPERGVRRSDLPRGERLRQIQHRQLRSGMPFAFPPESMFTFTGIP
jgi:hypothetical protein